MAKEVLVTGGAGYIGSHVCKELAAKGYQPVALDNLSTGHIEAVKWGPLVVGDVGDPDSWGKQVAQYHPIGIIHLAAKAYVGESYSFPLMYYQNNVSQFVAFMEEVQKWGPMGIVFSSSCSVYGNPQQSPVSEKSPLTPLCPYAETKVIGEWLIRSIAASGSSLNFTILRYFNAAGCDPDQEIGETHDPETHLIPLAILACMEGRGLPVFGNDHPTKDGTCLRDYVHVSDLASAHVTALEGALSGKSKTYNLGSGEGATVLEVCKLIETVVGKDLKVDFQPRRKGDASALFASNALAREELGWAPRHSNLRLIIETAHEWIVDRKY